MGKPEVLDDDNCFACGKKNPVGLKLNNELNSALGTFFKHHIFIWADWMTNIIDFLSQLDLTTNLFSIFGIDLVLSTISDFTYLLAVPLSTTPLSKICNSSTVS